MAGWLKPLQKGKTLKGCTDDFCAENAETDCMIVPVRMNQPLLPGMVVGAAGDTSLRNGLDVAQFQRPFICMRLLRQSVFDLVDIFFRTDTPVLSRGCPEEAHCRRGPRCLLLSIAGQAHAETVCNSSAVRQSRSEYELKRE